MERRRGDLLIISERLGGHSIDCIHAQPDDGLAEIIRRHDGHLMREAISAHHWRFSRTQMRFSRHPMLISRNHMLISRNHMLISRNHMLISRHQMLISRNQMLISRHQKVTSAVGSLRSALLKSTSRVADEATCCRMRSSCSGITVNKV